MEQVRVAVLDGNAESGKEIAEALEAAGFSVCIRTADGAAGLEALLREKPDAAVLSLVLGGLDGIGVLDGLQQAGSRTRAVVLGSFAEEEIIARVMACGAKYYLIRPVSPQVVVQRVRELLEGSAAPKRKSAVKLEERISSIFIAIGIPPHIKGYGYLREGIRLAVEDPAILNSVTKGLYPAVAEKFGTTASKVERAIRHSIEVAWNRQRTEAINAVFGVRVYIGNEKPTNSEFIALVADKLLLEGLSDNT